MSRKLLEQFESDCTVNYVGIKGLEPLCLCDNCSRIKLREEVNHHFILLQMETLYVHKGKTITDIEK